MNSWLNFNYLFYLTNSIESRDIHNHIYYQKTSNADILEAITGEFLAFSLSNDLN